ncbi:unnamed protein product, partial [Ectocarpus sp. 8 AP-2014]
EQWTGLEYTTVDRTLGQHGVESRWNWQEHSSSIRASSRSLACTVCSTFQSLFCFACCRRRRFFASLIPRPIVVQRKTSSLHRSESHMAIAETTPIASTSLSTVV